MKTAIQKALVDFLPFAPNGEQRTALGLLETFLAPDNKEDFFVLRGSAGTGKTSLVKAMTEYLGARGRVYHLAAPTGRAATVIGGNTGRDSRTIHSLIYTPEQMKDKPGEVRLVRKAHQDRNPAVYIVDEASMIPSKVAGDSIFHSTHPLLDDLLDHIRQANAYNKLVLIGDNCQLPPVNEEASLALNEAHLRKKFAWKGGAFELSEVMRQKDGSVILDIATRLREEMHGGQKLPYLPLPKPPAFSQCLDRFCSLVDIERLDSAVMIAFRNEEVNLLNREARKRIFSRPDTLCAGDIVTLFSTWYDGTRTVQKGDTGVVHSVDLQRVDQVAGLRFANAEISFVGTDGERFFVRTKVLLDVLTSEKGSLSPDAENELRHLAYKNNPVYRQTLKQWDDPHLGAMRLRYGYALTAHKAQGGEWDHVFLHTYMSGDARWKYTAVTRARKELSLIGR